MRIGILIPRSGRGDFIRLLLRRQTRCAPLVSRLVSQPGAGATTNWNYIRHHPFEYDIPNSHFLPATTSDPQGKDSALFPLSPSDRPTDRLKGELDLRETAETPPPPTPPPPPEPFAAGLWRSTVFSSRRGGAGFTRTAPPPSSPVAGRGSSLGGVGPVRREGEVYFPP